MNASVISNNPRFSYDKGSPKYVLQQPLHVRFAHWKRHVAAIRYRQLLGGHVKGRAKGAFVIYQFSVEIESGLSDRSVFNKLDRLIGLYTGNGLPFSRNDVAFARQNKGSAEQQTANSDYAAAQAAFDEWKEEFDTCEGDKCGFEEWLRLRLNSAKAPNCA